MASLKCRAAESSRGISIELEAADAVDFNEKVLNRSTANNAIAETRTIFKGVFIKIPFM
ncbi:hypothetical protein LBMAG23_06100 [Bacteroidota bacterium]|nr:hypothetical protein LBMAG23_06100 [Bacteroidota bacterium]